jgi:signal transduction histidine kinase
MSAPSVDRTMPLRRWLAIGFVAILLSFFLPFVVIFGLIYHTGYDDAEDDLRWARTQAQNNLDRWTDPTWQAEMTAKLDNRDIEAIYRINDSAVFSTSADPFAKTNEQDTEIQHLSATLGETIYSADFLTESDDGPPGALRYVMPIALISVLSAIAGVSIFLRRTVVEPLAATSDAAGRVAVGELDVTLPDSRVREVAEMNAAFSGMSAALQQSLDQQAKLEEERRLFIGAIAHDLRTPLFSLRGSLEGLATGIANTPEKQERYLTVAREKAGNLERLISDLFDFTRLEYLQQEPHREEIDLSELLKRGVDGAAARAEEKQIELVLTADTPLIAHADVHMMRRSIENVLDNAIRHTPNGGRVTIERGVRGGFAWFSIADTGPGIAAEDLPHIFTPLYRSDASRNSRTGGAGLGLSIARNMLRAHGGDLTAGNRDKGGAIFEGTITRSSN